MENGEHRVCLNRAPTTRRPPPCGSHSCPLSLGSGAPNPGLEIRLRSWHAIKACVNRISKLTSLQIGKLKCREIK